MDRRPIKSRDAAPIRWLATYLAATDVTPHQISAASVAFAFVGTALLLLNVSSVTLLFMALCVQLRLLCNVLDGLVAVEGGKKSAAGPLFNDIPDRISDTLFIVGTGYAVGLPTVGWIGALLAIATAYVRLLGGALGYPQDFTGPMAKAHRMFALTVGCLLSAFEWWVTGTTFFVEAALVVIMLGSLLTCVNRIRHLAADLEEDSAAGAAVYSLDETETN